MQFTLLYDGPLRANGDAAHKQELRMAFHAQLDRLWNQAPLSGYAHLIGRQRAELADGAILLEDESNLIETIGGRSFAPLVSDKLDLACEIDITMLRPGPPGEIVTNGGDIDNRLKTLFDALSTPDTNQVNALGSAVMPQPLFCLLKDDKLITSVKVRTDSLLRASSERHKTDVVLVIHSNVFAIRRGLYTLGFA